MGRTTIPTLIFLLFAFSAYGQLPSANFTASTQSGCSPLIVDFMDGSNGNPTSWFWEFGNGGTSTLKNPSATYFTPGVYTVRLTVRNARGTHTLTRTNYITVYGKPVVGFGVNDSTGCYPLRAQFTDTSRASAGTSNTSWLWDFGDGTQSTEQNPLHTYTTTGNFMVTLRVTNDKGCFTAVSKPAYIRTTDGVQSLFSYTPPNVCRPPFAVSFTSSSSGTGTLSYHWDFGDGNTSDLPNPTHTYTANGNYTVSLATTSSNGCSDTLRRVNLFQLQQITTAFTAPDSICLNDTASFINTSSPAPAGSVWTFGDATTASTIHAGKVYTVPGTYTVRLVNQYGYCSDSATRTIKVSTRPVAQFATPDTFRCGPPYTVAFTDASQGAVSWKWDFGDGGTSTQQHPTHTYTDYGEYDVSLIVTNASGCTDTLVYNDLIKIIRPVITIPALPQSGCIPYSLTFTPNIITQDEVTSYLWDFGDGNTSTAIAPTHTYTVQGTYDVRLTITTATGCTETLTITGAIRVGRPPVINFTAMPTPACAFQFVQFQDLTNEADEWIWIFGDGESSTIRNPIHQYADTGLFDVVLVATNNGCRDTLRKDDFIRIKPPIARFQFRPDCSNRLLFQFRDSSVDATSWFWDFGDGNTSTAQHPVHTYAAYGNYTVRLTVRNDTCQHTTSQLIRVFNENPNFTASQTVACRVANIHFTVTNVNPANMVSYQWNFGNGTAATGATSISQTYDASGLYSVSLVATDIYGCTYTVNKPDYIRIRGPLVDFGATNTSGCKGLTTTFTDATQTDGIAPITNWRWDFGDGNVQSFNTPGPYQHVYAQAGTYSVKLTVTDANGCRDSAYYPNMVTTSDPAAQFYSADTLACPGSPVRFVNTTVATGFTSSWDLGNNTASAAAAPSLSYSDTGRYTIRLIITDQYGCSDTALKPQYIRVDMPVASYTVSDSISACTPFAVTFTNTSHYSVAGIWELSGGINTQLSPTQYYVDTGVYHTSLIAISPGGCRDTAYKDIWVFDTIGTRVTYTPLSGCKPLTVDLFANSNGPMRYTWDFGDGVLLTNTIDTLTHVYDFFGDFVPKIIMTDPSGCVIPVTGKDTIRIIGTTAKFGLDNRFFCDSGFVRFTDSTTFNDSLVSYTWDFGDGQGSNEVNPGHQYTAPGFYTVSLSVVTENNCVDTFTLDNVIKIVESPLVAIGGDTVICVDDFMRHLGTFLRPDTSVVQWSWQFPNGNGSNQQNPALQQYGTAGVFELTTVATNSSGCTDTARRNILVNPLPVITMPSMITKETGIPLTIPATYSPNTATYNWTPGETLSCTDCPQPETTTKFNTIYTVQVVDSNGCRNAKPIQVVVVCPAAHVFLPNTFSPNGDGSNDQFYVRGRGLERVKSLRIFNRWGEVVFEQGHFAVNDPAYGWNGRYKNGHPVPDVYVYQVEVFCENGQIIKFEGNVALIL